MPHKQKSAQRVAKNLQVAAEPANLEQRILILAPTGNDAPLTADFLTRSGLTPQICRDVSELCAHAIEGCGAILLAEETLGAASISHLVEALARQPEWSDIPVTIITSGGEASQTRLRHLAVFGPGGNVALLERPFRPGTLTSTLESALRSRRRQYEVRKLMQTMRTLMREQEAQARLFDVTLSSIADLAYTFDLEGNWIYANKPLLKLWGKTLVEISGKSSLELGYPTELARRLKRQVKEVIATRKPLKGETYFTDAAGIEDYHEYILSPVLAADGTVTAVCGTTRLTTERKRAESLLRQNEALFSALVDLAPTGVYVVDAQFRLQQINSLALPAFAQVEPKIGRDFGEVMNILWGPKLGGQIAKIFRHTLTTGERYVSPRSSGFRQDLVEEKSYDWEIQRVTLPDGQHGVVCYFNDITKQRREAQALQQLAAIVESSEDAIISKDLNGIITSWNRGAEHLFGYSVKEAVGQPIIILMPPDRLDEESNILERIHRNERIEPYETIRQRKDGKLIEISLAVSPIKDAEGMVVGASKIARDITKQKQAERELEQAHKEAVAASRAKDDFLAALSHELRTPLNPALLLASESADNLKLPEVVRLNFEIIRQNIELEARLIDDLLDLTRITTGKMVLNKNLVDVHDILTDAIATTQAEQQEKKLHLDIKLEAPQSMVEGDAVRLQQVFWNVLKNAVKFTPDNGKVTLETSIKEGSHLLIKITDTGIGMSASEVARVFSAFAQGDHAGSGGSHRFGGLGLGLAISKNLVELHSGKITAQSAGKDQGSSFTIELPMVRETKATKKVKNSQADQSPTEMLKASSGSMSVLLVEDHEITRTVLTQLLARRNYRVIPVDSMAKAREAASQNKFDLLISDIGLPDGNGNDLMKEFREKYGLNGIALTGYGMEEDIARGKAAGFVTHLTKPVRIESLENALRLVKNAD